MAEQPSIELTISFKGTAMNSQKEVWFIVDHNTGEVNASARAPSPERECALLEQGMGVYRRTVALPETRPTTLRNLQAEENKNLREQVAAGKDRMAELLAELDRLTSAPVSQLRADLELAPLLWDIRNVLALLPLASVETTLRTRLDDALERLP